MYRYVFFPSLILVCILFARPLNAQVSIDTTSTEWILDIDPQPAQWSISPSAPSSSQTISFSGPTTWAGNTCYAMEHYGGEPALLFDGVSQVIELFFIQPDSWPPVCPLALVPVHGLKGSFGPLSPGTWRFYCTHQDLRFSLTFSVDGIANTRDTIYVDSELITLKPNGYSWETAFTSLDQALQVAEYGSVIKLADGTYTPAPFLGRFADFSIPNGVKILGGFRGYQPGLNPDEQDPSVFQTILSGDLNDDDGIDFSALDDNCYHVVNLSFTDANTLLEGVTIQSGYANGLPPHNLGGGLLAIRSHARVQKCRFQHNVAMAGAGAYNEEADRMIYSHCTFENNMALMHGAGMTNVGGVLLVVDCLMVGNQIPNDLLLGGSAASNVSTTVAYVSCTIADNYARSGGALTFFSESSAPASKVTINNTILWNGGNEISTFDLPNIEVTYSNLQGGWFSGQGNLNEDPLFVERGYIDWGGLWQSGNYHILGWSPCIDAGDPNFSSVTEDVDGEPRMAGRIDIGVDEVHATLGPPPVLP